MAIRPSGPKIASPCPKELRVEVDFEVWKMNSGMVRSSPPKSVWKLWKVKVVSERGRNETLLFVRRRSGSRDSCISDAYSCILWTLCKERDWKFGTERPECSRFPLLPLAKAAIFIVVLALGEEDLRFWILRCPVAGSIKLIPAPEPTAVGFDFS